MKRLPSVFVVIALLPGYIRSSQLMTKKEIQFVNTRLRFTLAGIIVASATVTVHAQDSGPDIYKSKCQMCHGATGLGDTPAGKSMKAIPFNSPDLVKASDAYLIAATKNGKGKMPAYAGKLTDTQINEVIAYIRKFQK